MKIEKLIYIAIDKEDGEPILSAFSEEELLKNLEEYCGLGTDITVKIIEDRKINYDGEYSGNLIRVITYQSLFYGETIKDIFEIWSIEIGNNLGIVE